MLKIRSSIPIFFIVLAVVLLLNSIGTLLKYAINGTKIENAQAVCDSSFYTIQSPSEFNFSKGCITEGNLIYSTDSRFTFFQVKQELQNISFVQTSNIEIKDRNPLSWSVSLNRPAKIYILYRHIPGASVPDWITNSYQRETFDLSKINTFFLRKNESGLIGLYDIYSKQSASDLVYFGSASSSLSKAFSMYVVGIVPTSVLPNSTPRINCISGSRSAGINGNQLSKYSRIFDPDTTVEASSAIWNSVGNFPVTVGGTGLCFHGGRIFGGYAATTSWTVTHPTAAFSLKDGSTRANINSLYAEGIGDGIKIRLGENSGQAGIAEPTLITGVHLHDLRDDCIESDWQNGIILSDSLLDGCYVTFATQKRNSDSINGSANVWDIRNNLVYLRDQVGVYSGNSPGHGMFFKWDTTSPKIKLYNNIFRVDSNVSFSNRQFHFNQDNKLAECGNNIMIYLGSGSIPWYGEIAPKDPVTNQNCFTEKNGQIGKEYWDSHVALWRQSHGI